MNVPGEGRSDVARDGPEGPRTVGDRQQTSARQYLNLTAVSDGLRNLVALAAEALDFRHAMVDIVDSHNQYILVGTADYDGPVVSDRANNLCDVVVRDGTPLVVGDADDATVPEPVRRILLDGSMRSYIGVPILGLEGLPIGALCVFDDRAREVSESRTATLAKFATVVQDQLERQRTRARRGPGPVSVTEVSTAIDRGEIVPWYQPVVNLSTGQIDGFEALARWMHPSGEMLLPDRFVDSVEDSEVIIDLDLAMLRQALIDLERWHESSPGLNVSVNLSGRHFLHSSGADRIRAVVEDFSVDPARVVLELTETIGLADTGHNLELIEQLRSGGYKMALDDVGTGWSSLQRLATFPVFGFKIDRSITALLGTTSGDAMVRALAGFGSDTGSFVVAEGIDSEERRSGALALGCTHGQGFLWSEAIPADRVPEILASEIG